jgi:hypothetical protein
MEYTAASFTVDTPVAGALSPQLRNEIQISID